MKIVSDRNNVGWTQRATVLKSTGSDQRDLTTLHRIVISPDTSYPI